MGYFPNGTAGEAYEEEWCHNCYHYNDGGCAVMLAHLVHNYAECNNTESILHMLIPISADGLENEECRMFLDVGGMMRHRDFIIRWLLFGFGAWVLFHAIAAILGS